MPHGILKDFLKTNKYSFGQIHLGNIEASLMFTIFMIEYYHIKDIEMLLG